MKFLFLIYSLGPGGAEKVTTTLANELVRQGHTVEIAVLEAAAPPAYPVSPAVVLHDLALAASSTSKWRALSALIRKWAAVRRLLKRRRPDVAIGMMTNYAVLIALTRVGLPLRAIGSERAFPPANSLPFPWPTLRKFVFGMLDAVVVQTRATADWIESHTNARRVEIIGNPVEMLGTRPPRVHPDGVLPAAAHCILAVGRLVEEKGFGRLIDAFAAVANERKAGWHLVILGEGPLRLELEERVQRSGVADLIHLPGNVGDPGAWLDRSEIYVLSSYAEGMSNALMEAMAHGVAPIAFDTESGNGELIEDGRNGVLVAPHDEAGLAAALARLMDDISTRQRLGQAAQADAAAFEPDNVARQWVALANRFNRGESQ